MRPYLGEKFGNAASRSHPFGWAAEEAVALAREQVAALVGATPAEIIFTSGATESNNTALIGASARRGGGGHIVTVTTEHPSILDPCEALRASGTEISLIGVDGDGRVSPEAVAAAVRDDTIVVSVMLVNNEIGVIQPVSDIARAVKEVNASCLVHSDLAQALGRVAVDVGALGVDLASLSAHKIYGPKGVGALYVSRRARRFVDAILHGGGHERGLRSGTLPVPLCVGFGAAARLCASGVRDEEARQAGLRDRLLAALRSAAGPLEVNGSMEHRVGGNLNVSFDGVSGEAVCLGAREVAISTGSACASATGKASHVLAALGHGPDRVAGALRFGLGRATTAEDVDAAAKSVARSVQALRAAYRAVNAPDS